MWVEGYLAASDKPQPMIGIEVKFIETSRDPKKEFGVDWSGTLGQNGTFRQSDGLTITDPVYFKDPTTGLPALDAAGNPIIETPAKYEAKFTRAPNASGGFRADLSDIWEVEPIKQAGTKFFTPYLGLLSAQDLSFKLRAYMNDEDTRTTSYPRMVTLNNREVAFRSVRNQPVLGASSSSSLGSGATTTSSVEYLPIGTVLNILPKKMEGSKVLLNMSVTVSSIVGQEVIAGNPYPVASSRVYNAPVEVDSGYTVAVGGLNEATERQSEAGVPVLGKIPVFGWLFKHKGKAKNQKDLMVFITPTLMNPRDGGLPEEPQSVIPQRGPGTNPSIPKIDSGTGALLGGPDAVRESVDYMKREAELIRRTIDEKRATDAERKKLGELKTAVTHLDGQVGSFQQTYPHRAVEMTGYREELKALNNAIWKMQREMFARKFF
jgi:type II secretory pathway component GspD/PulD (secretin)